MKDGQLFIRRLHRLYLIPSIVAILTLHPPVLGSDRSSALTDRGLDHLKALQQAQALADFQEAVRVDPKDSEAAFFLGVTYNQLGRGALALSALQQSRELGCKNPDLSFELGWSLLLVRDWNSAIAQLSAYEKAHPGERPQASIFLARAYLALKDYPQAQAALDRALAQAPGDQEVKDAVEIEQYRLARARGDARTADARLGHVTELVFRGWDQTQDPGSATLLAPMLRPDRVLSDTARIGARPIAPGGRRWWGSFSAGAGYDTAARGDAAELRARVAPAATSAFADVRGDVGFMLFSTPARNPPDGPDQQTSLRQAQGVPDRAIWLEHRLSEHAYARESIRADLLDNQWSANFEQRIAPSLSGSLRLTEDYTMVNYFKFRNEIGAATLLKWELGSNSWMQMGYDYAHDDYLAHDAPIPPKVLKLHPLNRDAENHVVNLAAYWMLPRTSVQTRGGYSHTWNFAQGSDFDFHGDAVFVGIAAPLPLKMYADVSYTHSLEKYENVNSDPLVHVLRRDSIDSVTLGLTRPLSSHVTAYFQYNFNSDGSNVLFYTYSQHVVSTGITVRF